MERLCVGVICNCMYGNEEENGVSGSKRHSLQAVELSNLPSPSNGAPIYRFLGMRTRWMAGAVAHKGR